jgi:hypothetical protein
VEVVNVNLNTTYIGDHNKGNGGINTTTHLEGLTAPAYGSHIVNKIAGGVLLHSHEAEFVSLV